MVGVRRIATEPASAGGPLVPRHFLDIDRWTARSCAASSIAASPTKRGRALGRSRARCWR